MLSHWECMLWFPERLLFRLARWICLFNSTSNRVIEITLCQDNTHTHAHTQYNPEIIASICLVIAEVSFRLTRQDIFLRVLASSINHSLSVSDILYIEPGVIIKQMGMQSQGGPLPTWHFSLSASVYVSESMLCTFVI